MISGKDLVQLMFTSFPVSKQSRVLTIFSFSLRRFDNGSELFAYIPWENVSQTLIIYKQVMS